MNYDDSILLRGLDELGIGYDETKIEQLHFYYEQMVETNHYINLTAITEYPDVCVKHWLDSLSLVRVLNPKERVQPLRLIDVGTGAGFPGIPLAIFFPYWKVTLMDSLGKRVMFLDRLTKQLGRDDITCLHARAEELSRKPEHREQYDLCVSRAVTQMPSLSELCLPFVKVGGGMVAYKSAESDPEIELAAKAIHALGGKVVRQEKFLIPESRYGRCLVRVDKTSKTDSLYPRGGGKPMKSPIV